MTNCIKIHEEILPSGTSRQVRSLLSLSGAMSTGGLPIMGIWFCTTVPRIEKKLQDEGCLSGYPKCGLGSQRGTTCAQIHRLVEQCQQVDCRLWEYDSALLYLFFEKMQDGDGDQLILYNMNNNIKRQHV